MTRLRTSRGAVVALACVLVLYSRAPSPGQGMRVPVERAGAAPKLTPHIYGARHCASCHDQVNNGHLLRGEIDTLICRMDEYSIFQSHDKHRMAFQALAGSRGADMSQVLGYDVQSSDACLNCHSTPEHGKTKQQYTRLTDGVTCVACHGAVAEWVEIHQRTDNPEWSGLDRRSKQERYGMIDLWDPVRRAQTCTSCHIGDYAQGKVVTHVMYAAGHPPLPGFEAATFGAAQPRHWESIGEKRKLPERNKRLGPTADARNLDQSHFVVVSGLVAFRDSMKLFADQASAGSRATAPKGSWPDFARFDCNSCHHDLRADAGASWRQLRARGALPGRPNGPEWPLMLVRLGMGTAGSPLPANFESELDSKLAIFRQSIKARPFGEPEASARAARDLAEWVEPHIKNVARAHVDVITAHRLLVKLCEIARDAIPDYDSARQIAWAFQIIYGESVPVTDRDPALVRILTELDAELALNLRPKISHTAAASTLTDRLRPAADFNPTDFQERFAVIARRLAATGLEAQGQR